MSVGDRVVLLYALLDSAPETQASQEVVRPLRQDRAVLDGTLQVGGQTASDMDATALVRDRTPRAIGFVVAVTFVILFLLLGSVVLPLKAMVMNLLSVAGSFGALVWVFQEGHLGIAAPRPVEHALPVLLFCVLFGLSMDYEVLMLSRIKESLRADGRQHPGRGRGAGEDRGAHHERRGHHGGGVRGVRARQRRPHPRGRLRHGARGPARRDARARAPGAGDDAALRQVELVGARAPLAATGRRWGCTERRAPGRELWTNNRCNHTMIV